MNLTPLKMTVAGLLLVAVGGCSSSKPKPDPLIKACPERVISVVQANQSFLEQVVRGSTPAKDLTKLKGLKRKATLVRNGEEMGVAFYQTGIPGCPWVMSRESLTPVVVQNGVIMAVGTTAVQDMTAKGWSLKEAAWPWQRYDFGYLPQK